MTLRTALRLGRVSNLPTVWTNVLAGAALNGAAPAARLIVPVAVAASLLYVGGMYLNDAFDRRWDAEHRRERPIPAGEVAASTVFAAGFGLIAAGLALLAIAPGGRTVVAGLALGALIVLYDVSHKGNPVAPLIMGLCRVAVYVMAGLAAAPVLRPALYAGAGALLAYLVTLTIIAKNETRHPRLPKLVGQMIAGICLVDGVMLLLAGNYPWAVACPFAFLLTRRLQRRVPGT